MGILSPFFLFFPKVAGGADGPTGEVRPKEDIQNVIYKRLRRLNCRHQLFYFNNNYSPNKFNCFLLSLFRYRIFCTLLQISSCHSRPR